MRHDLNEHEIRVLGVLLEKSVTTPDQYPMTLNALTNGCNQKTSREPVMDLSQGEVLRAVRQLEDKYLLSVTAGGRSNVEKFTQRLVNTPMAELQLTEAEYAVVTLMMLRGPQTPGELRSRSGRLYSFADNAEAQETLRGLIEREEGAVAARLPRTAGRLDNEYTHLFAGEFESAPEEAASAERVPRRDRVGDLEARVAALESALLDLATRLGESIDLSEQQSSDDNPSSAPDDFEDQLPDG